MSSPVPRSVSSSPALRRILSSANVSLCKAAELAIGLSWPAGGWAAIDERSAVDCRKPRPLPQLTPAREATCNPTDSPSQSQGDGAGRSGAGAKGARSLAVGGRYERKSVHANAATVVCKLELKGKTTPNCRQGTNGGKRATSTRRAPPAAALTPPLRLVAAPRSPRDPSSHTRPCA